MSYTGSPPPRQGEYSSGVDPADALYHSDTFSDPGGLRSPLKATPGQNPSSFRCQSRRPLEQQLFTSIVKDGQLRLHGKRKLIGLLWSLGSSMCPMPHL